MSPGEKHLAFVAVMAALLAVSAYPLWRDRKVPAKGRRENVKAVLSLIYVLALILATGVAQFTIHFLQVRERCIPAVEVILLALVACPIIAVFALKDLHRRRWQYGRVRAFFSLALATLCFTSVGGVAYRILDRPAELPPFVSEPFNFFIKPSPAWTQTDTARVDPKAIVAMTRNDPTMTFTVVAKAPTSKTPPATVELVDTARAQMQKSASEVNWVGEMSLNLHGLEGTLIECDANVKGRPVRVVQWLNVKQGYSYQLTAWASSSVPREILKKEAIAEFRQFEVLGKTAYGAAVVAEVKQQASKSGAIEARDYQSFTSGFSIKLAGSQWKEPVRDLFSSIPEAEFGISCQGAVFVVVPLPLGICDPSIDALAHTFLWKMGVESLRECVSNYKEITHGPLYGYSFDFQRSSFPNTLHHAEVLKGNGFAYLLLGKAARSDPDAEAKLADVIGRVEFDPAPTQPKPSTFTTREREIRGDYLLELGRHYLKLNQFEIANDFFNFAHELVPERAYFVKETVDSMIAAGDLPGAASYLKANMQNVSELIVRLAWLQVQAGDSTEALKSYARAFSADYRNDTAFADYVRLLGREGQTDVALAAVSKYLADHDSLEVRLAQATVYRGQKQPEFAVNVLKDQLEKHPGNSEAGIALASVYLDVGRYKDALDACDNLVKAGHPTALVHYLRGQGQYGLRAFDDARSSFEAALTQQPKANPEIKSWLDKAAAEALAAAKAEQAKQDNRLQSDVK